MDFFSKQKEEHVYQSILLPNNYIKPEFDKEFSNDFNLPSSKRFSQDFYSNLEDGLSFTESSSSSSFVCQPIYDPNLDHHFTFPKSINFDICDHQFKAFDENSVTMQNNYHHVLGLFSNNCSTRALVPNNMISSNFLPINLVVPDDASSSVTPENNNVDKQIAAQKISGKASKYKKKSNSSKGQWTADEDRYIYIFSFLNFYDFKENILD